MEAIAIMPSEIEELHTQLSRICSTLAEIKTELREVRSDVRETRDQAKKTNGNVTDLQLWRARIEGEASVAGGSWKLLLGIGTLAVTVVGLVLANT